MKDHFGPSCIILDWGKSNDGDHLIVRSMNIYVAKRPKKFITFNDTQFWDILSHWGQQIHTVKKGHRNIAQHQ